MFDRALLPTVARLLDRPARILAGAGVRADALSLAGFAVGLLAATLTALQHYHLALLAFAANRVLDGLDGAVARLHAPTDRGAFLDIAFDFFVYAALPFGFALADPTANALPAAALLLAFVGTGSSFLAFAVIAERRGLASIAYPQKGFFYIGGLTEGSETIACFVAMLLWPAWFPVLAWGFAALCGITAVTRWLWGFRAFSNPAD
jgi:phosphatidylglycerophosphate synthase